MDFGGQIKKLRQTKNYTQEDLGKILHVSRQTISSWENNRNLPDLEMVVFIAEYFSLSLDQLILGDDVMTKKLVKDGSDLRKSRYNLVCGLLILLGALSILLKGFLPETLAPDGTLQEYFFLLPVGFFLLFLGLFFLFGGFLVRMVKKYLK